MSGLRERQKEHRRQQIADAALALFKTQGFVATTLEQIASGAGVSAPTVVNYFGGKQEILLALLREPDQQAMRDARARLSAQPSLLDALCDLDSQMTRYQLQAMPASLWRELAPFLLTGELMQAFQPWNDAVVAEASSVLVHFQKRGVLREGLDVGVAARLFNQYANMAFIQLATAPRPDPAAHALHMRAVLQVICGGLLKA